MRPPDSEDRVSSSPPNHRLQCDICDRSFARTEHLRRHTLTHTKTRPFRCSICEKEFFRRDALQRHLLTHQNSEPSLLQKGARACQPCALAKVRCSGDIPCSRCRHRSISCLAGKKVSEVAEVHSPHDPEQVARASPQQPLPSGSMWGTSHSEGRLSQSGSGASARHHLSPSISQQYPETNTPSVERAGYILHELKFTQTPMQQSSDRVMASPLGLQPSPEMHVNGQHSVMSDQQLGSVRTVPVDHGSALIDPRNNSSIVQQQPGLFDAESWNPNLLSTINWLTDETFGLDNPIAPLALSESVYFNDFPHMFAPSTVTQIVERAGGSLHGRPSNNLMAQSWLQDDARTHLTASSEHTSGSPPSEETHARSGQFYVDSEASRLPRVKRRKYNSKPIEHSRTFSPTFFSLQHPYNLSDGLDSLYQIQPEVWDDLFLSFQRWCVAPPVLFTPFSSVEFPPKAFFDHLITCYFQAFHPTLPFLHPSTLLKATPHWLLILAMSAIGCHCTESGGSDILIVSLQEFLRRALFFMVGRASGNTSYADASQEEESSGMPSCPVVCAQVKLLHTVGVLYSGHQRLRLAVFKQDWELSNFCQQFWNSANESGVTSNNQDAHNAEWLPWIEQEVKRRTGYSIWLLDCMWAFHFDRRPQLSLEDAKSPLPCNEKLWAARDAKEWQQLRTQYGSPPSLMYAIQRIYIEKHLSSDLGEFSRILLIHGLFQRSWEVETYFRSNLSRWNPTATRGSTQDPQLTSPVWLPSVPTYAKWRNSACDCLDILHWSANAAIGLQSGLEHPTVIHLHLARVILLTPYSEIVKLARFSVEGPISCQQSDILDYEQTIRKWATQDQYKARLAMIHAGVIFWHVRRFSVSGFYEPVSVALAALALWAFATFHDKPLAGAERDATTTATLRSPTLARIRPGENDRQADQSMNVESDSEDPVGCDIILLDRPTDDELVQNFVRRGHTMIANLAGVGNLYGERGPELVLQEGRKILYGLNSWGVRRRWLDVLDGLLDATKRKRK